MSYYNAAAQSTWTVTASNFPRNSVRLLVQITRSSVRSAQYVLRFGPPNHILADGVMDSMARVGMCGCGFAVGGFVAIECATIFDHEHYIAAKVALGDHTAWTSPFGSAR
ncbi:hypothetical protein PF008_g24105 [Phytophthora fragariae]|uniref:Uncharacterized protein n=1 Tax=Phytophthora fragariae TaxID=53985 RepID=A0A6G0QNV4_9STRA|nr:hypothetical protein PF008_g24105 [Phytophthora fragariae]